MKSHGIAALGAGLAALGVVAGAFGAHMLEAQLTVEQMQTYDTAVFYQLFHALVLVIIGTALKEYPLPNSIAMLFIAGIVLFSGSLYTLVLSTNDAVQSIAGPCTPIGGTLLIVAWVALAVWFLKKK